ncbi:Purine or other phosphorylase family 1 [Verrucomicrobia bacterium]|nr:Purine or other phosphorylase family 1 [Verrucomicrobiota bacterium]
MSAAPERGTVLVCFAVKEEANSFTSLSSTPRVQTLLTGIGPRNAERAIRAALARQRPRLVLSCGFAGALRSGLRTGTVLFALDGQKDLEAALVAAGARPTRFHCCDRVASTAAQKQALRQATGADAVEMESQTIRAICREKNVPSATLRVILDEAEEDLPLDFNLLMTADQRMDYRKLALALVRAPAKIGALRRLQKQSRAAAENLAQVLSKLITVLEGRSGLF